MKTEEMVQAAQAILADSNIPAEVYQHSELPIICVDIPWGDWKHSHMRADIQLMDKLGLECILKKVTEEDGSDCYSATHYYTKGGEKNASYRV